MKKKITYAKYRLTISKRFENERPPEDRFYGRSIMEPDQYNYQPIIDEELDEDIVVELMGLAYRRIREREDK